MVIPHTGSSTSAGAPPSCASVECVWWSVIVAIQGTNSAPRPALLHVLSRIGVELRLAHLRAEVIGLALILAGRRGLRRLDLHAAHGIFFHQTLLDSVYLIGASAPSGHRAIVASGHRAIGSSGHRPQWQSRQPCSAHVPHDSITRFLRASRARNTRTPALLAESCRSAANVFTGVPSTSIFCSASAYSV